MGIHHQVALALVSRFNEPEVSCRLLSQPNSGKNQRINSRDNVIDALGKMGPKAKPAVPDLKRWLDEANAEEECGFESPRKIDGK